MKRAHKVHILASKWADSFLSGVNLIWILLNSESQRAMVPYAPFKWCWQRQWATGMLTTLETRFKPELCTLKIMKRPKVAHVRINKTYEQVFNIPSYHGNANWKYTTILSHSVIMGAIRRINNKRWQGWGQEGQWQTTGVNVNYSIHCEDQQGGAS